MFYLWFNNLCDLTVDWWNNEDPFKLNELTIDILLSIDYKERIKIDIINGLCFK